MNNDFTQSRLFYLELAKANPSWSWIKICLSNVLRILNKEKAAATTATEDDWSIIPW